MYKTIYFNQLYFIHTMNPYKWMPYSSYRAYILNALKRLENNVQSYDKFDNILSYKINSNIILDIFIENENGMFATIGNTISTKLLRRIRNIQTLAYVEQDAETVLEEYTFFYLDYTTGVITALYSKGAPKLATLTSIFSYDGNYCAHINSIRQKNIKGMLTRTTAISSVGLKFALPPSTCFKTKGETLATSVINKFINQGFENYELILYNQSPEKKRSTTPDLIESLIETYEYAKDGNVPLQKINVTLNEGDARQQTVNLLELMLSLQINIKISDDFSEQTVFNALEESYKTKYNIIMQNIRPNTDHCFQ